MKQTVLTVRIDTKDYRALKARAKDAKMPLSMYVRRLIDRDAQALSNRLDQGLRGQVESALPR